MALTSDRYLPARILPTDISTALSKRVLAIRSQPGVEAAQMAIADLEIKVNSDVQRAMTGGLGPEEIAELLSAQKEAFRETQAHPGFDDAVRSGKVTGSSPRFSWRSPTTDHSLPNSFWLWNGICLKA